MEKLEEKLDKVDKWLKGRRKPLTWQSVFGFYMERPEEPGVLYATFHGRMLAATIDSILLLIVAGPLLEIGLNYVLGPTPQVDYATLSNALTPEEFSALWESTGAAAAASRSM